MACFSLGCFLGKLNYLAFQHFNQHLRMRGIICRTNSSSVNLNLHCLNFHLGQFALALGRLQDELLNWKCCSCYYYSCLVLSPDGRIMGCGTVLQAMVTLSLTGTTETTRSMCVCVGCRRKGSRRIYADLVLLPSLPSVQI